jgi:hypothetical protein
MEFSASASGLQPILRGFQGQSGFLSYSADCELDSLHRFYAEFFDFTPDAQKFRDRRGLLLLGDPVDAR